MEPLTVVFIVLGVAVGVGALAFWIWMLVDCITQEPSEGNDKLVWVIVIIATKLVGAIVYYFVRRPKRMRLAG